MAKGKKREPVVVKAVEVSATSVHLLDAIAVGKEIIDRGTVVEISELEKHGVDIENLKKRGLAH